MKRFFLSLALMLTPAGLLAQEGFPALYDVSGVAANDVLNMRAAPDPSAPIVGTLAPDATGIEAVQADADSGWLRVNSGETAGWASPAYLTRQPGQPDGTQPALTRCFGTEPFWSLMPAGAGWTFQQAGGAATFLPSGWQGTAAGRSDRYATILLAGKGADVAGTIVVGRDICSDGMSDRLYGLTVDMILTGDLGPAHYAGCCSIAP
ncbi:SH3 domain-containing protein [Pseudooceanicola nanhaiensis]|uniref:SH3 domain-containing protein n=1 Tax=Pseudooceanicola nanhaiensis TaxID=375761 RepID=UPI001CD7415C|nr:SH3 domain-containing protein [Pseudooceanicola nanhaiensis]MCA0920327.1 SH3 domain-containing protein [Pseudooceanicola nanhaiensis]